MNAREEASLQRRQKVYAAAAELLDELGVGGLTIRHVAERAGVAPGSVFMYADNKADLVSRVYGEQIATRWHRLLDRLGDLPALERMEKFYLGCVDIFYEDLDNVLDYYKQTAQQRQSHLEPVDRLASRLRDVILEGEKSGEIAEDADVDALAYAYQGLYSNVLTLAESGASRDEATRVIAESFRLLRVGVQNRSSRL